MDIALPAIVRITETDASAGIWSIWRSKITHGVSFAQILPDETSASCIAFLRAAVAYYAGTGVRIEGVMTDNGIGYKNTFRAACDELGIRHIKPRPYTPRTNGKAEHFVQTSLREWGLCSALHQFSRT